MNIVFMSVTFAVLSAATVRSERQPLNIPDMSVTFAVSSKGTSSKETQPLNVLDMLVAHLVKERSAKLARLWQFRNILVRFNAAVEVVNTGAVCNVGQLSNKVVKLVQFGRLSVPTD